MTYFVLGVIVGSTLAVILTSLLGNNGDDWEDTWLRGKDDE